MQRFLTFTIMRFGVHPARAGFCAMIFPWVFLGLILIGVAIGIAVLAYA